MIQKSWVNHGHVKCLVERRGGFRAFYDFGLDRCASKLRNQIRVGSFALREAIIHVDQSLRVVNVNLDLLALKLELGWDTQPFDRIALHDFS